MKISCCKDKAAVENNFSRYAELYDAYADVQNFCADELINRMISTSPRNIIDIGCGTGGYTLELRNKFKGAGIIALDISDDMIRIARRKCENSGIEFVTADAERFDLRDSYDLITSNAAFQWFGNLDLSLRRYKAALAPGGSIAFSTFGPRTFWELGRSLKEVLGPDAKISAGNFLTKESLTAIMKKHFRNSAAEEMVIKRKYKSLEDLLKHIKYTGTRGSGVAGVSTWTRTMLDRVEDAYMSAVGVIEVSYQIFYCEGSR